MIESLERRFGRFAVPDFIRYVVLLNALVYVLQLASPGFVSLLTLSPQDVFAGEVWRLFTWIFIPETLSPLWILFALWFLWFLGDLLEGSWGSFRVNLFYISGWVLTTGAALVLPGAHSGGGANLYLNLSLLLAAATLNPTLEVRLFLILPIQLKWLAWLSLLVPALMFFSASLAGKAAILLCLMNYLLFFGPQFLRNSAAAAKTSRRREKFQSALAEDDTLHRCVVCGKTDRSHPELEFRVSSDDREYCMEHLPKKTHSSNPN